MKVKMMNKEKHTLLVCGGRTFGRVPDIIPPDSYEDFLLKAEQEQMLLREALNRIKETVEIEALVEGDAKGADRLAGCWAVENDIPNKKYPADWKKHGKGAGPIRNQVMLDEENITLVVAFPGGDGTKDMIDRAKKAGLPVYEVSYEVSS